MARRDSEFEAFFEADYARLYRLAFLLARDPQEAEDMAQEAMVRTYRAWERIRDREHPFAYARMVLVNHRRSLARRKKVASSHPVSSPDAVPTPDADRVALWQELARLSRLQREAIVLRYYEDLTEVETATVMRCPVGTVKSHVRRGLSRLKIGLTEGSGATSDCKESV